jgi:ornithine cyclodeaminase/alanine dehydrogenase-like protein (mu-crystallin family)
VDTASLNRLASFGTARLITADAVRDSISPVRAIDAVERALVALARGSVLAPQAIGERVPQGTFHVKTCAGAVGVLGTLFVAKVNANFPGNPSRHGLPTIQGAILAFDTRDGTLLAVIDSGSVTSLRTAATTAVAIRHLARKDARIATVVGCGAQGKAHLEMLGHVLPLQSVFLHDVDLARARELADWARQAGLPFEVAVAADFPAATGRSDVVVTCTGSDTPFLEACHVEAGTMVAAVGADNESKAEIGISLLEAARIVTDRTAQCLSSGDLRRLAGDSAGAGEREWLELGQVIANGSCRVREDEVVVFDSTGLAVQDLAIVAELLGRDR